MGDQENKQNDNKVEDFKGMTPEKMAAKLRERIQQEKIKEFNKEFDDLVKKQIAAEGVLDNINREIDQKTKEYYILVNRK